MIEHGAQGKDTHAFNHSLFLSGYLRGLYYLVDPDYRSDIGTLIDVLSETNGVRFVDFQS